MVTVKTVRMVTALARKVKPALALGELPTGEYAAYPPALPPAR